MSRLDGRLHRAVAGCGASTKNVTLDVAKQFQRWHEDPKNRHPACSVQILPVEVA